MIRKLSMLVAIALTVALIPHVSAQDELSNAYVRFVHLVPDATDVEIAVDGTTLEDSAVGFGEVSDWQTVPAGTSSLNVMPVGSTATDAVASLDAAELLPESWVTVLVTAGPDGSTIAVPVLEDLSDMSPGVSRVTFVNATGLDDTVNFLRDGVPFVTELASLGSESGVTTTTTLTVDAGTYDFAATPTQSPDQVIGEQQGIDIDEGTVYLIVATDTPEAELVIHQTDRATYLMEIGAMEEPGTIIQAAQSDARLTPWLNAVEQAGLTDLLSGEGPYTVFVPADFVMDDALEEFSGDAEALADWLRAHIVEGDLKSRHVFEADTLTALDGTTLTIEADTDTAYVSGAEVLAVNIPATNGTIHLIGQMPQG